MIDGWTGIAQRLAAHPRWQAEGAHPDLTDWATVGVLLGMLMGEEASCRKGGYPWPFGDWTMVAGRVTANFSDEAPTVGEAVALALLEVWDDG